MVVVYARFKINIIEDGVYLPAMDEFLSRHVSLVSQARPSRGKRGSGDTELCRMSPVGN